MITLFLKLNIFVIPGVFISLWKWVSLLETFTHLNNEASLLLSQYITLLLKLLSNTLRLRHHFSPVKGRLVHEEMQAQRGSRIFAWWYTGWIENRIYSNINKRLRSCVTPFWVLVCRTPWSLCVKGTVGVRRQAGRGFWALPWITMRAEEWGEKVNWKMEKHSWKGWGSMFRLEEETRSVGRTKHHGSADTLLLWLCAYECVSVGGCVYTRVHVHVDSRGRLQVSLLRWCPSFYA